MNHVDASYVYGDDIYVDDYYLDEKWEYIAGFPMYMVSDKARVWSVKNQKFLKLKPLDRHGHLGVCLRRDGVAYYRYIHRLVAEAFIPNPKNLPIVRHLYDDPSQNAVDDLAWGTHRDNAYDAILNGTAYMLTDEDRYRGNYERMTPIIAINTITNKRTRFQSQGEASRILGIPQANIWKVLRGQRRAAGNYIFKEVSK